MFRVLLYSQWKWTRLVVTLGTIAAFVLPIASVQGASYNAASPMRAGEILNAMQSWGVLYPALAAALGLLVAMATWAPDHRGRHVHALSLPLPRWRYALLRFGAGLLLLTPPVLALLVGAVLATNTAAIPVGLEGYPVALCLRFALATTVAFSIFFAISAGTTRTAAVILALMGAIVAVQWLAAAANLQVDLLTPLQSAVLNWPGPLAIFSGRWMLIDV
ncbi:MAG TPA: hypothetical protein VKO86_02610 [Gemmatimonadales bacterium]|nr:hypothetical protein [Gemmatimonadales bacterium]